MQALGNDPDKLQVDIIQMVRLIKDCQEYKMSKKIIFFEFSDIIK